MKKTKYRKVIDIEDVKKLIKDNLEINVRCVAKSSDVSYQEKTYVELYFLGEVISTTEIDTLTVDR